MPPHRCLLCRACLEVAPHTPEEQLSTPFCTGCLSGLGHDGRRRCCARAPAGDPPGLWCSRCRRELLLRTVVSAGPYAGGLRWAVTRAKFAGDLDLWRGLAGLLAAAWSRVPAAGAQGSIVVPVPLGAVRRRRRGFNQALVLAAELSRRVNAYVAASLLYRRRETPPQSRLGREARRTNVARAFAARRRVPYRPVVLVDDVVTTGATLNACAAALLAAGAAQVDALTLAAAPPPAK